MKLTFIGTGLMGRPMAERLLRHGHSLVIYNRTREKALPLEKSGARIAATPKRAVEETSCAILMVSDINAINAILFPQDSPPPQLRGRTIIQMSTISPEQSMALRDEVERHSGDYLEAPVLGSIAEAEKGELVVIVGSTKEQYERWLPLLRCFSPDPTHVGSVGQAAGLKLALNQLIASLTAAISFSLGIVIKRNTDVELFMRILRKSSLYAPHFDKKLHRMLEQNYENPTFPLRLLLKDVNLMVAEGCSLGLETAALEGIQKVIQKAVDLGWAEKDYTSIFSIIEGLSRIPPI